MNHDFYRGWRDPIGKLVVLRIAVEHLAQTSDKFKDRMERATFALTGLSPDDFPERIRGRAKKVLQVRQTVAKKYVEDVLWHFEWLSPRERRALIGDILALYEACLLDVAKIDDEHYNIAYPQDR